MKFLPDRLEATNPLDKVLQQQGLDLAAFARRHTAFGACLPAEGRVLDLVSLYFSRSRSFQLEPAGNYHGGNGLSRDD